MCNSNHAHDIVLYQSMVSRIHCALSVYGIPRIFVFTHSASSNPHWSGWHQTRLGSTGTMTKCWRATSTSPSIPGFLDRTSVDFLTWFRDPQFYLKKGRLFLYATWGCSDDRNNSTSVFFRFMASEKMSNRSKIGSLEASRRLLEVRPVQEVLFKNDQKWAKPKGKSRPFFWWKFGYAQISLPGSKIYWVREHFSMLQTHFHNF